MLFVLLSALETEAERSKMSEIYENHKSEMLRYAMSITKNKEAAEDAVHNAFLAVIKHKEKLFSLSRRDLRIQIVIITKNKCIDLLRKQGRLAEDPIDDVEYTLESTDMPIEERIIFTEQYETLRKHIAALDETSRLALEMKYLLGMTYKEIGEELGMTAKHVDTKIMRAKAKVRKLISEGGNADERKTDK